MQHQIEPNKEYTVVLTGNDIINIQVGLLEIPAKFANPLIQKIAEQLQPKDEVKSEGTKEVIVDNG